MIAQMKEKCSLRTNTTTIIDNHQKLSLSSALTSDNNDEHMFYFPAHKAKRLRSLSLHAGEQQLLLE
jgi:hypothetical protein